MVRRAHEPEQDITLTGETNKQDFPAKVVADDAAQEDNRRRVQAAKEADLQRQTFEDQRKALDEKPVTVTTAAGTKVAAPKALADKVKG